MQHQYCEEMLFVKKISGVESKTEHRLRSLQSVVHGYEFAVSVDAQKEGPAGYWAAGDRRYRVN